MQSCGCCGLLTFVVVGWDRASPKKKTFGRISSHHLPT